MELLPHIDRDALAMEQKTILKKINQIQGSPHLLSYPEMLFLATAQKKEGVAPETLSVNEMKFLENTAAGEIKNAA